MKRSQDLLDQELYCIFVNVRVLLQLDFCLLHYICD